MDKVRTQGTRQHDGETNRQIDCERGGGSVGVLPLTWCRFHFESGWSSQTKLAPTPTTPPLYTIEPAVDKVSTVTMTRLTG
jgi:hypothetical protein